MGIDLSKCDPVIPHEACPNCGWSTDAPYLPQWQTPDGQTHGGPGTPEPHPVIAEPLRGVEITSKCPNCGAPYNLDKVACSECGFEPTSPVMYDKILAEKNVILRAQFRRPLPARPMPVTTTASVKPSAAKPLS